VITMNTRRSSFSWALVLGAVMFVLGLLVSLRVHLVPRMPGLRPHPERGTSTRQAVPDNPPPVWQAPMRQNGWAVGLFNAPRFSTDRATGRFVSAEENVHESKLAMTRPRLRVLGIHRDPLPIELKGVVRPGTDYRGVFLVAGSPRTALASVGQEVGPLPLRVEELWDEDGGRPAAALLRDERFGTQFKILAGTPCFAGSAIASIAVAGTVAEFHRMRAGDSIDDGLSLYEVEFVSEGPDESVTVSDGDNEYVIVVDEDAEPAPGPAAAVDSLATEPSHS
jgi:hypothetical protein